MRLLSTNSKKRVWSSTTNNSSRLSNRVNGLSFVSLLNCFLSGLHKEIQHEFTILKPSSLTQAIDLAKIVEAKINASRSMFPPPRSPSAPISAPAKSPQTSILGQLPHLPIRCLNPTEQHERRSKGLCFNCDEKFHPGHRCARKQFLLFLTDDTDADEDNFNPDPGPHHPRQPRRRLHHPRPQLLLPVNIFISLRQRLLAHPLLEPCGFRVMFTRWRLRLSLIPGVLTTSCNHE